MKMLQQWLIMYAHKHGGTKDHQITHFKLHILNIIFSFIFIFQKKKERKQEAAMQVVAHTFNSST